ncbi:MAG: 3-oxoacyl-[acyl-carrier-protein] reductase [Oscillospiraceae bacterium]
MTLTGKTAVVTGAARGLGRAIAVKMAQQGAAVALIYLANDTAAAAAVREIEAFGGTARAYRCDVSSFEGTKQTVGDILADFGGVDILVNNAGIVRDGLVVTMKEADFDAVIDTNLKGAFNMVRQLYQHFMRKRAGRIINITSVAGLHGNAGQANYASAKAGLVGLTKSLARELASRGVTCNAIAPGLIASDMTSDLSEKAKTGLVQNIPLGRFGTAQEVAELTAFLAGDAAGYITGTTVQIDGGLFI